MSFRTVLNATSHMRAVARSELPSTREAMIWTRLLGFRLFIMGRVYAKAHSHVKRKDNNSSRKRDLCVALPIRQCYLSRWTRPCCAILGPLICREWGDADEKGSAPRSGCSRY